MRSFEYANPTTEAEALELLNDHDANTAVLAGGTDLLRLLDGDLFEPDRVVDIKNVESMSGIERDGGSIVIGALTTLEDLDESRLVAEHRSLSDVIRGIRAIQIQQNGTLAGDLCHMPNCWYFRNGYGLLGLEDGKSLVAAGDNRYHAILGNSGPAKFVSASRFAPSLIAWQAEVRIIGPQPDQEEWLPLEYFYVTPKTDSQGVTVLKPGQLVSHIRVRQPGPMTRSAAYEVLELAGLDWPLAAAAVTAEVDGGIVRAARIVMGHVAPTPWVAHEAADALLGQEIDVETADRIGQIAVARATPLKDNHYKVQLAKTAVKRALLKAVDQLEGGL